MHYLRFSHVILGAAVNFRVTVVSREGAVRCAQMVGSADEYCCVTHIFSRGGQSWHWKYVCL